MLYVVSILRHDRVSQLGLQLRHSHRASLREQGAGSWHHEDQKHAHHHHLNWSVEIRNSLHELVFFQPLHDDGEDDHSWCCHGDPRDDHLCDAFYRCFLRVAQFVAIFICDSNAIQDFSEKQKENDGECCLIMGMLTQLAAATAAKGTQRATRGGAFFV